MLDSPAPDITVRRKDYRLAEPGRTQGMSVRYPPDNARRCAECPLPINYARRAVRLANRAIWLHVMCAIKTGVLVVVSEHAAP